jgi:hypothetical protein
VNIRKLIPLALTLAGIAPLSAQTVILSQPSFPTIDSTPISLTLPNATQVTAADLPKALADPATHLLVLPYGSAFPEDDWDAIAAYLQRGGNLLTLGGRPFTRPVDAQNHPRPETYAYARQLFLSDYQSTGFSTNLQPLTNRDLLPTDLPALTYQDAYSVVIRLSDEGSSTRIGASGTRDSELTTLLWGTRDGQKLSAPIIQIDHFRNNFTGGRWIMLNCSPTQPISPQLVSTLAKLAGEGPSQLTVVPSYPLYLASEVPSFDVEWTHFAAPTKATIDLNIDAKPETTQTFPANETHIALTTTYSPGFHTVLAKLTCDAAPCGIYRTGFWVRDEAALLAGPRVTVDHDYFQLNGRQLPVVGTTYMDSKSQRLFLRYPNPYVWDQDMQQISAAGLNMLRTGLWTDWDTATGSTGIATEHTLRTLEAFLMTAEKHNLPVQFNLFAFMPEVFGGGNPYLDPEALRRERAFVASVVTRFHSVPFLIWDLMNEPSFDNPGRFFGTKPNKDAVETAQWNQWLLDRYGSRENTAALWKTVLTPGPLPVPDEGDFYGGSGGKVLSVYDFNLFAQQKFLAWVQDMHNVIRSTGSAQLVTVGTDEGGGLGNLSPTFFAPAVDFTTMHSWWLYDDLLWDSLVAKQAAKPMLVQETGVMFEPDLLGRPRRSLANEASLLQRKVGIALGTGAGAIEWLWNINSLMQSQQEVTIGAIRWDGTEKPETQVLKSFARFAASTRDHFRNPEPEPVVILTSQALQYSPLSSLATTAQQRSVRVINYQCQTPARVVSENNVADITGAKLVILPSPQALSEPTWQALLTYVNHGGNLLITGSLERDEHWQPTHRLADIGIPATPTALNFRGASLDIGPTHLDLGFSVDMQKHAETLTLPNNRSYLELKLGTGTIFLTTTPIELADSPDPTEAVYRHVLAATGITPPFQSAKTSPAILIRPRFFADSTLYLLASESSTDQPLDILDTRSNTHIKLTLPAQACKLILIDKTTGRIIASSE